ncbi:MAG: tRNA 5-methoxyuridine(34)/uridine 5-oxyacetic acid(34) synthase CmoB [Methylococcaceae bacterium]|nr:tRNA 5-methoxyuridine(34)/uridine 5-oxyacetic acid(34) synthase CmoB [Methylococcaceae bacterium]
MIDYQPLYETLTAAKADAWVGCLPEQLLKAFDKTRHGTLPQWLSLIASLPAITPSIRLLDVDTLQIGRSDDLSDALKNQLESQLRFLQPWRKGPYQLFGLHIDTEWRSDWKWNRLKNHIAPLEHRLVLDVGCGNGYHCWRMLGAGAKMVVGIDPLVLNVMQFHAIRRLYGDAPVYVLPMGLEDLPAGLNVFDTVFSMGVLYHRRSPIDHLLELKQCLKSGGELVLETLIIDGGLGEALVPEGRYANMRNVWFIPSCETLMVWMKRCGFVNIRLIDVTVTKVEEQRSTNWMTFNSLKDFLDPKNPAFTIEGLPAPKRAILIANAT